MDVTKTHLKIAAICFGIMTGIFLEYGFGNMYLSIAGGIITTIILAWFFNWFFDRNRLVQQAALTNLRGQDLLHEGAANHFRRYEAVGGKLYLLTNELVFKSHRFNIQNHTMIISLHQIKEVSLYSSSSIVDNGLAITTLNGKQDKYVVNDPYVWKEKIEEQMSGRIL